MGRKSELHTLFPHLTDGNIVIIATLSTSGVGPLQSRLYDSTVFVEFGSRWNSVPHTLSPPYRWGETVNYTLFPLQYSGNLKANPTLFFPIVIRWGKRVYPLHSFFPIIEGEKVQRVKVYPYPSQTVWQQFCHISKFSQLDSVDQLAWNWWQASAN